MADVSCNYNTFAQFTHLFSQFISARLSEMHSQMRSGKFADPEKQSMLQRMIQYRNASNEPMPDLHIVSEGMGHTCVTSSFCQL